MATIKADEVQSLIDDFQKAILLLDERMSTLRRKEEWTVQEACEMYSTLADFKNQVALAITDQENYLIDFMGRNDVDAVPLENGQSLIKEMPRNRKGWKHNELAEVVAGRIESLAFDMDTGERVMTTSQMITKLLDYVQPSYWRVTALSDIGLNVDDYCQTGDPEPKISMRKVK